MVSERTRAVEDLTVDHMTTVLERLVADEGVGFVGCQKCVHPALKLRLESKVRRTYERSCLVKAKPFKVACGWWLVLVVLIVI